MSEVSPRNAPVHPAGDLEPVTIELDASPLALDQISDWLDRRFIIRIHPSAVRRMEEAHAALRRIVAQPEPAYGINTGFGNLCSKRIPADQLAQLQLNLVRSHAVGVGPLVPRPIVRWMMLLKLHAFTFGASGVSQEVVNRICRMLEADALPLVPCQGSLGASGDLAPLAHMVLPMIGEGRADFAGEVVSGDEALKRLGVAPLNLGPKEGLALINGTQFMSGHAVHAVVRASHLLKAADVIAAMSLEGCMGSVKPFDERLHRLRPHPGAIAVAENIRRLMADSEILASHADCDRVQDPYSLRCVPQVHGASRDAVQHVAKIVETEINSVTDNPVLLDDDNVISGGLFHGQSLALALDYLAIALAELASISERRTYLLLSGSYGLPVLLLKETGLNSGFMVPHYTTAALVSENKGLCTPASVDSIPTSLGQEDHVSMGARAAVKCLQVLDNTETVLAIEQLCAAQALDFRAPLKPGVGPRIAHGVLRKHIDHATADRLFGEDIQTSLCVLRSREVLRSIEQAIGPLH